jgi:putative glutamine amidotransferase
MSRHVGVTMRLAPAASYPEPRDALSHDFTRMLEQLDARFTLIPNGLADPVRFFRRAGCDALLLTGGDDLGNSARDEVENALLSHAVAERLPVLGVCRGLQHVARFFGAPLCRELSAAPGAGPHVAVEHSVQLSGRMQRLFATEARAVNSFHAHAVLVRDLPTVLELGAQAAGGLVEGVVHRELPLWAVQWHPERTSPDATGEARLLRHFLAGFPAKP